MIYTNKITGKNPKNFQSFSGQESVEKYSPLLGGIKGGGYCLLIFILLLPLLSNAQDKDWQWIKRGGSYSTLNSSYKEEVYDIGIDSQQNVYILSTVGSAGIDIDGHSKEYYGDPITKVDYVLASFSCGGTYRWSKIIGGKGVENPPYLEIGPNDNIYVAGRFGTCDGYQPPNDMYPPRIDNDIILQNTQSSCQTLFLVKYDPDGELMWLRQPQEPVESSEAYNVLSMDFASDNDGNLYWGLYLPAGTYANGAFTNMEEGLNYFIFKYDTEGNFIEAIPFDFNFDQTGILNLKFYRNPYNGHFYYTNRIYPGQENATVGGQPVTHPFFLASFDENGNFLWKREDTGIDFYDAPIVYNLQFDSANNIYLGGLYAGFDNPSTFLGFGVDGDTNPSFVMKTDPTAENLIWGTHNTQSVNIGGALLLNTTTNELAFTSNAGQEYTWGDQTIQVNGSGEYKDVLLARFDPGTGECINLNVIPADPGYTDRGTALAVDAAGDYLVGGGFGYNLIDANGNETYNIGGQSDFFIAKYATQACNEPVAGVEGFGREGLKAYPNPVKGRLSVTVQGPTRYKLYTVSGKLVASGKLTATQNSLSTKALPSGLYLLQLQTKKGGAQTVKVVKE